MKFNAVAPSNIALIKYMGKTDSKVNRPTNTSLSYTLPHLRTLLEIETSNASADSWQPLTSWEGRELPALKLSEKGAARFLAHLSKLKTHFGYEGSFIVRSANDFPSDCGLASSASSFAALTMGALEALAALTGKPAPSVTEAAEWSRKGSGSSCRSFFGPWSVWSEDSARAVPELGYENLLHQVIVVDEDVKSVSSSSAHLRVATSALFHGRPERAEERAQNLIQALARKDWAAAFELSWAEFWDMHALFETAQPSFGYMTPGSLETLRFVRSSTWEKTGDGPLVTMDAGPNVHLLYRPEAVEQAKSVETELRKRYMVISNVGAAK
jgi:diphosphomevalonate decarboxylase